jgi:phosphohistidine phosphatase
MMLFLVHHGDALDPLVDPRRPLSTLGRLAAERVAAQTAARGAQPSVVWHSGKLRARQTAEIFWRACNALAECSATRDLQPGDPASWMRDRLRGESRDIMIVGHFPHLPALLALLLSNQGAPAHDFPPHGVVALSTSDEGTSWSEAWRIHVPAA